MKKIYIISILSLSILLFDACTDNDVQKITFPEVPQDVTLKSVANSAGLKMGVGIDYEGIMANDNYKNLVAKEFDNVTFGYHMKHGAIVKDDGSYNFTNTDAMVNWCKISNLDIYGHTLAWHKNNNGTYLRSIAGDGISQQYTDLLVNGNFETTDGNGGFTNWGHWGSSGSYLTGRGGLEVNGGTYSLKVVVSANGNAYATQCRYQGGIAAKAGANYKLTFWARSLAGGKARINSDSGASHLQIGGGNYWADFNTTTEWTQYTFLPIADGDGNAHFTFDLGSTAGTYFIDDVKLVCLDEEFDNQGGSGGAAETVRTALKSWITTIVTRYKDDVKAWDVVNEPMADGASGVRTSALDGVTPSGDTFYWSDYLGRTYASEAFEYAHAANADATLFINDYNLESNAVKLDSLIAYVKETQATLDANGKGTKIQGIGTQMHISYMAYPGIKTMFEKLAATGLQIKITELDVKVNSNKAANHKVTDSEKEFQAAMYKFIVETYRSVVPKEQQYGITIWGINDGTSWLNETTKSIYYYPLLWDDNYARKPAYSGVVEGLK